MTIHSSDSFKILLEASQETLWMDDWLASLVLIYYLSNVTAWRLVVLSTK